MTNKELEAAGLGAPKKPDPGAAEVRIDQTIRYKIKDPYNALSFGSIEQIERTIVAYATGITRTIAASVEMDGLIAHKSKVGKCVHLAFQSKGAGGQMKEVKASIKPWMSYTACAIFTFIIAFIIPFVILDLLFDLSILPTLAISALGIAIGMAGWEEIPPGHKGVLIVLGKRARNVNVSFMGWKKKFKNLLADEGNQWGPWPAMGYIVVDTREKTIPNKDIRVFAGIAPNATDEISDDISYEIDETYGPESGADVLAVITEEVMPVNPEIIRAREALKIEKGKSEAQDEDMRRQAKRAKILKDTLPSISDKDALIAVRAQENQITHRHISVEGASKADSFIAGLAAVAGEIKDAASAIAGKNPDKDKKGGR